MARKKHTPEQIVALLRQIEVAIANGKLTPQACREAGIKEQSYYRWRKEYGGLKLDPVFGLVPLGSAALDLCYVTAGRFDGFYEETLKA